MTLNKSNLRIYLGVLIFALVVQPHVVPVGLTLEVFKNNIWPDAAVLPWDERWGEGKNKPASQFLF